MNSAAKNEDVLREYATLGAAVLAAQRVEFLLYGLVAHVKPELKRTDKRFSELTPESFLRGDLSQLRVTLGQLAKAYGHRFLLSTDELEAFVNNRNLIAHDYWRLSKASIRDGATLENPIELLRGFIQECQRWEEILRGLMAHMKLSVAVDIGGEQEVSLTTQDLKDMDRYQQHVRAQLLRSIQ